MSRVRTKRPRPNITPTGQVPVKPTYSGRKPGRPSLMTPEVTQRFMTVIRAANFRSVAAAVCGLNIETVEYWIKRGRGQITNAPAQPEHVEFVRLLMEAEAAAEAMVIGNLAARSRVNTQAGIFLASRRWPERWPGDVPEELPPPPPVVVIDQSQTNQSVIVVTEGQFGDLIHTLLASQRTERAAATPTVIIEERQDDKVRRHDDLDTLRAEAD
jgi:hypothetical protein